MSVFVWIMIGIAIWHLAVLVPDRFLGGIIGALPAACVSRYNSVCVMLSGCTGHPGMQTIGTPPVERNSQPR